MLMPTGTPIADSTAASLTSPTAVTVGIPVVTGTGLVAAWALTSPCTDRPGMPPVTATALIVGFASETPGRGDGRDVARDGDCGEGGVRVRLSRSDHGGDTRGDGDSRDRRGRVTGAGRRNGRDTGRHRDA